MSLNFNVMQICIFLNVETGHGDRLLSRPLMTGLATLWDGSDEGERKLLELFNAIRVLKAN